MNKKYVVGIDLGGTTISGGVLDYEGNIVFRHTIDTKSELGEKIVLERIIKVIDYVIKKSKIPKNNIKAIGIGSPGPLDIEKGIIITSPNLPFKNFNIVNPIKNHFKISVYLDNDANAAAVGEYKFGSGKGSRNMIFITVSTGIGGGAILNGNIYRGSSSNALEIGHMTLKEDGAICNCGNFGCAEALASGTAIAKKARMELNRGKESSLKKLKKISAYNVFQEAKNGDKLAQEIVDEALEYLGICVSNIIITFDPDTIVIGGGVSKAGDIIFNKINQVVKERCFEAMWKNTKIIKALLLEDAGIIGAASLAIFEESK
ncbi:ROK family protein [Clostridium tetani]|uniref:Glucokinase n=1 Tax=Clostridium tetani (strain Massachusetts / E88) TaxID=212717 RepID=Q899F1_CLOTE|nr:ROK family protein [Clostridium tetani]AAO34878.1 transcriptional repressor [Clostridium tetani E88]AVP55414.1 ROK family protein [Clostridium tetani]KGI36450.1 glucokinase [Clostridium tetani]KGI37251.1 glucokinase [Clostridium tetani ATCC 9441]KGI44581.1 glucokinase [Clostridium tetani]